MKVKDIPEEELLKAYSHPYATVEAVGKLFGVHPSSVYARARSLGVRLDKGKRISCKINFCNVRDSAPCCVNCPISKECKDACKNNPILCRCAESNKE